MKNSNVVIGAVLMSVISLVAISGGDKDMMGYHLKQRMRRAIYGRTRAQRMYHEEVKQKSIEAFKSNPNRAQFLKNNPGFLDANPEYR